MDPYVLNHLLRTKCVTLHTFQVSSGNTIDAPLKKNQHSDNNLRAVKTYRLSIMSEEQVLCKQ